LQQEEFLCAFQGSYRLLLFDTVTFLVIGCSLFTRQTIADFFQKLDSMDVLYKKGKMMITKLMTTALKPMMPLAA